MVVPGMQDGRFLTNYSSNSSLNKDFFNNPDKSQNVLRTYVQSNANKIIESNLKEALTGAQTYRNELFPKN